MSSPYIKNGGNFHRAKKKLGQNFLINPKVVEVILTASKLSKTDKVIEVGPGLGILTEALSKRVKEVEAIELDDDLIPDLLQLSEMYPNVKIIHTDALKTALPKEEYKVVANIPYYITSPLLTHFLQPQSEGEKRPSTIVIMVQKEVAEKICATPGDYSILSLSVQVFGRPEIISIVGKENFRPSPKIDSAILKIEVYPTPLIQNFDSFFKIISAAFAQKRKTLLNSLQNGLKITKEHTITLLKNANISENERPQKLTIEQWKKLSAMLNSLV